MSFLRALLDGNEREVARLRKTAAEINALEPTFEAKSDEELAALTADFRARLQPAVQRLDEMKEGRREAKEPGEQAVADAAVRAAFEDLENELNAIAPEAFAAVRTASNRKLKMR